MRGLCVLLLLAGCDRVFSHDRLPDAAPGGEVPCAHGTPFTSTEMVPIDPAYGVEAARFDITQTIAYLALYPASSPDSKRDSDLFQANFNPVTKRFVNYIRLPGLNSGLYDSYPTISPDGNYLLYGTSQTAMQPTGLHVWVATAQAGGFDPPAAKAALAMPANATNSNEPYILRDGQTLYFAAGTGDDWDIYRMQGAPPRFGNSPVRVNGIRSSSGEAAPVVSDDELEIFFASNRQADPANYWLHDIYMATRSSATADFGTPSLVTALNTATGEWPVWMSASGCELYFIRRTGLGLTSPPQLFVARREP